MSSRRAAQVPRQEQGEGTRSQVLHCIGVHWMRSQEQMYERRIQENKTTGGCGGARARAGPEKLQLRKELAEHPFGTIKRGMGQGYFLMRGKAKVAAEMSITIMAYNMKRAMNIMGVNKMIEALG